MGWLLLRLRESRRKTKEEVAGVLYDVLSLHLTKCVNRLYIYGDDDNDGKFLESTAFDTL